LVQQIGVREKSASRPLAPRCDMTHAGAPFCGPPIAMSRHHGLYWRQSGVQRVALQRVSILSSMRCNMQERDGELESQVTSPPPSSERAPQRRDWQPPRGEVVEVATGTRAGSSAPIPDLGGCHS